MANRFASNFGLFGLAFACLCVCSTLRAESPVVAQPPAAAAAPPAAKTPQDTQLKFVLNLRDGSHLVCTLPNDAVLPVQTDFGKVDLPLKLVKAVQFNGDHETGRISLHNGDRISGGLESREFAVQTSFGKVSIPTTTVAVLESTAMPPQVDPKSETAAQITTKDASAVVLRQSDDEQGWRAVPEFLNGAQVYEKWTRPNAGMTEFEVAQSGVVYLACHFGYEGNSSGGWREQALSLEQFAEKGWKRVAEMRSGNGRIFTVLRKPCSAGEHFLLRCNKYTPPIVMLLPRQEQASK